MNPAAIVSELLRSAGISKSELARRSGVSRTAIDAYLAGIQAPTTNQLNKLAAAAGSALTTTVSRRPEPTDLDVQRRDRLIAVLELGETFPPKQFKPLPDLSDVWAAARERAKVNA